MTTIDSPPIQVQLIDIDIFFIKDDVIVGKGRSTIDASCDEVCQLPSAIFDAWSIALDACSRSEYEYNNRNALLQYQHVIVPSLRFIVGREVVHNLIKNYISSSSFGTNLADSNAFVMEFEYWEAVNELTEIYHNIAISLTSSHLSCKRMSSLMEQLILWNLKFSTTQVNIATLRGLCVRVFGGHFHPPTFESTLRKMSF